MVMIATEILLPVLYFYCCRSLILRGCYRITNTGVQAVCSDLKNLRELDIAGCPQVSHESLDLNDHLQLICSSS